MDDTEIETTDSFEDAFNEIVDAEENPQHDEADQLIKETDEIEDEAETLGEGESQEDFHLEQEHDGVSDAEESDKPDQPRDEQGRFTSEENELETLRAQAKEWEHRYNSDMGRQSAYQRKIAELEAALHEAKSAPKENPEGSNISDADWKALQEDYPDIAAGFDYRFNQYEQKIAALESAINPMQAAQQEQYRQNQFNRLTEMHPDWRDVSASDQFRQWVGTQPPVVQQLVNSDEAADAAYLIGTFKAATGAQQPAPANNDELKQRRERQLQQGRTISNRGARPKTGQPPADDFEAAFDYFASKS